MDLQQLEHAWVAHGVPARVTDPPPRFSFLFFPKLSEWVWDFSVAASLHQTSQALRFQMLPELAAFAGILMQIAFFFFYFLSFCGLWAFPEPTPRVAATLASCLDTCLGFYIVAVSLTLHCQLHQHHQQFWWDNWIYLKGGKSLKKDKIFPC